MLQARFSDHDKKVEIINQIWKKNPFQHTILKQNFKRLLVKKEIKSISFVSYW